MYIAVTSNFSHKVKSKKFLKNSFFVKIKVLTTHPVQYGHVYDRYDDKKGNLKFKKNPFFKQWYVRML